MATVSAHDVAAELRRRLPGLGTKKLHKLLYYCQGHHLAAFGTPLFRETISAWDMGPVVGSLWYEERANDPAEREQPAAELNEAQLNTIGYVVSRYGSLTGTDLEHLTHAERPWLEADARRSPGSSAKIPPESIRAYFATEASDEADRDIPLLDVDTVAAWLKETTTVPSEPGPPDSIDELRSRLSARTDA